MPYVSKPFNPDMLYDTYPFDLSRVRFVLSDSEYREVMEMVEMCRQLADRFQVAKSLSMHILIFNLEDHLLEQRADGTWAPYDPKVDSDEHRPDLITMNIGSGDLVLRLESDYSISENVLSMRTGLRRVDSLDDLSDTEED